MFVIALHLSAPPIDIRLQGQPIVVRFLHSTAIFFHSSDLSACGFLVFSPSPALTASCWQHRAQREVTCTDDRQRVKKPRSRGRGAWRGGGEPLIAKLRAATHPATGGQSLGQPPALRVGQGLTRSGICRAPGCAGRASRFQTVTVQLSGWNSLEI